MLTFCKVRGFATKMLPRFFTIDFVSDKISKE